MTCFAVAITTCCFVKELPGFNEIKEHVGNVFLFYKRFRSVPSGHYWHEVEVDLNNHVTSLDVENQEELMRETQNIMNRQIPTDRPRWEV